MQRRGLTTLGQSVNRVTSPAMRRRGFAQATIAADWETIVGRPLCDHSRPSRVVFPRGARREGTLHLVVSGAFAPELQHLSPQIIERINGHFGYPAVARIELHHGRIDMRAPRTTAVTAPAEPDAAITRAIDAVADTGLSAALTRLARSRATRLPGSGGGGPKDE